MKLQLNVTGVGAGSSGARVARLAAEAVRRRETEMRQRRDRVYRESDVATRRVGVADDFSKS